eukprot:3829707-Amphidinium_carterae.1
MFKGVATSTRNQSFEFTLCQMSIELAEHVRCDRAQSIGSCVPRIFVESRRLAKIQTELSKGAIETRVRFPGQLHPNLHAGGCWMRRIPVSFSEGLAYVTRQSTNCWSPGARVVDVRQPPLRWGSHWVDSCVILAHESLGCHAARLTTEH